MSENQRPRDVLREVIKDMPIKLDAERERRKAERAREERIAEIKWKVGRAFSKISPIMFAVGALLIIIGIFYALVPFFLTGSTVGTEVFLRHLAGGFLCLIISGVTWFIGEVLE